MDNKINVTDETINLLIEFKNIKKFIPDEKNFYPGATSEEIRLRAQNIFDKMIENLIVNIKQNPTKKYILLEMRNMLKNFINFDSEENDQVCTYCERILDIFQLESSDGLLNNWRYGFDPNK